MVFIVCFVMLLKPVLPLVEYSINYEYVSKVLCVNKAKPAMHCNGKCHLMKELAKVSENEKPTSSDKKGSIQESEILFFEEITSFALTTAIPHNREKVNCGYSNLYAHCDISTVFHPPTLLS
jgi:hypothetical protein